MPLGWGGLKLATFNPRCHLLLPPPRLLESAQMGPPPTGPVVPPKTRSRGKAMDSEGWQVPASNPIFTEGLAICKAPSTWRAEAMLEPASSLGSPFPSASAPSLTPAGPSPWESHPFLLAGTWEHSQGLIFPQLMGLVTLLLRNPGLISQTRLGDRGVECRSETWDKASN